MERDEIKRKLTVLFAKIFQDSQIDLSLIEYVDFADELGMDSIAFITLIIEIETEFGITVPDNLLLMDKFKNMDDAIQIVDTQLSTNKVKIG